MTGFKRQFRASSRCKSTLYVRASRSEISCSKNLCHSGNHLTVINGQAVTWTDEDAKNSRPTIQEGLAEIPASYDPITAWRCWNLADREEDGTPTIKLRSVAKSTIWNSRILKVPIDPNNAPMLKTIDWSWTPGLGTVNLSPGCAPGIHSYKCPSSLIAQYSGEHILGRCELYGHVIEHELGYRSQELEIMELWVPDNLEFISDKKDPYEYHKTKERLQRHYGIEHVHVIPEVQIRHWAKYFCKEECSIHQQENRE